MHAEVDNEEDSTIKFCLHKSMPYKMYGICVHNLHGTKTNNYFEVSSAE